MTLITVEDTLLDKAPDILREALQYSGVVPVNEKFLGLYALPKETHTVVLIGGRGGGKTFEASRFITIQTCINDKRTVVLRDVKSLLEESILNEVLERYEDLNKYWGFSRKYTKMVKGIKNRLTGAMAMFTKGFKASSNDKKANLKGISSIDLAVIEEMEDITSVDQWNTFSDSLRKEGAITILILNTPDITHWVLHRYFNTESIPGVDGYYRVVPKVLEGVVCIQTTYEDNPYLPQRIRDQYLAYGDPLSPTYNPFYFYTAIKGFASVGRKGQVFKNVKSIKLRDYMLLDAKEMYGQDFGTASPAAMVGVKFINNRVYVREINYLPMATLELAKLYSILGLDDDDRIVCDSAEPDTWKKLKNGWKPEELTVELFEMYPRLKYGRGFNTVAADKPPGSVQSSIGLIEGMEVFFVEESVNLHMEKMKYVYDVDKNGNYTNEPKDEYDHLMDAFRYVVINYKGLPRRLNAGNFPGNR